MGPTFSLIGQFWRKIEFLGLEIRGQIYELFRNSVKTGETLCSGVIKVGDYDNRVDNSEKFRSRALNLRKRQILVFLSLVTDIQGPV